ncbi:hypothetical protein DICPUDRAFT_77606 [Dictyostelium purpureum]|uniref:Uncharacterized protein n=1 Tax=Dictyostelium purpureum TaxID=5786 RepID=F0ZH45_DICPU|nr:uncharacterized protein DICPUDRAFT_77606 [Dictyostelium purpureum]EGC36728.1 hypothetical protein DICPUDRAFT_77606 [Dictyostelium purpureum]|eukprot:XP_003286753.1 hypothetical protein DICPUDRAFT_77606 [Dictyostelium purpureum]
MTNNSNNNILTFQKYKITYKILENNNFYLEFLDDQEKYYNKTFTPSEIVDIGKGVFTNAETFASTIKRAFSLESCNSFELEKIKYNKETNSLNIILKIIVIEIVISLPRKTSYQNLEERVNQLSSEVVDLKQRLQFLEKFIINNSTLNNNSNHSNHNSLNMGLLNFNSNNNSSSNNNNNNVKSMGHISLSTSTPSTPVSSYSPYSSAPSTPI